jgi:hypothetical protein
MDPAGDKAEPRRRGSIRPHYGAFQARVTAGVDPDTGERIVLSEVAPARREAELALTRLLAEADAWKIPAPRPPSAHSSTGGSPATRSPSRPGTPTRA